MSDSLQRLEAFLKNIGSLRTPIALTADASTREYFRIAWKGSSAIACVYQDAFDPAAASYLDVTELFLAAELPVAKIYDVDAELGIIVQEDFGDEILKTALKNFDEEETDKYLDHAIDLIPAIQSATDLAFDLDSIASRLRFDTEKLLWELNFFKEHYFTTYKKQPLATDLEKALDGELLEIAEELDRAARVLCHRDFHTANLMISGGELKIIDHQDARIGSIAYDLVSLLLDRLTQLPDEDRLTKQIDHFLSSIDARGLYDIDRNAFIAEFRLQAIQRCLKAVGTFSFQSVNRGKSYFVPFIEPTLEIVGLTAQKLGRFPTIQKLFAK